MHKLVLIEKMETRNQVLNLEFSGKLHNSLDKTVPAVRIWRSQILVQPPKSLTALSLKNPLRTKGRWLNHVLHQLGSQIDPIKVLDKTTKVTIARESVMTLSQNETNVAGTLEVARLDKHRFIFRKNNVPKRKILTISRWLMGAVAMHQNCRNCNGNNDLSREHAVICSGADEYLTDQFGPKDALSNRTYLDQLLNSNRNNTIEPFYDKIAQAISMIYEKCMHFCQSDNGFWISRHRDAAPDGVG